MSVENNIPSQFLTAGSSAAAGELLPGTRLGQLRLTDEDLVVLKKQGTVQIERRGQRSIAKLRFRRGSQQVVRYIGGAEAGRQVQQDLHNWQAGHRRCREMLKLAKVARRTLRESKRELASHLEQAGYQFHGLAIRRRRNPSARLGSSGAAAG